MIGIPVIGIVAALPAEARSAAGAGGCRVVVSGVGAAAARRACATLIAGGVDALVSWGTAAGLTDALAAGRVVIAGDDVWADQLVARLGGIAVRGTIANPTAVLERPADKRALAAATTNAPLPAADADDRAIRARLLAELEKQPWATKLWAQDVIVNNGVVHLWFGSDEPEERRQAARVAAENVPGVRSVEEHEVPIPLMPAF